MIIRIHDLVINSLNLIESQSIELSANFQFSKLIVENKNDDILLIDNNTGQAYIDTIDIIKTKTVFVRVIPTINTKTKNFNIILTNTKTTENIIITGRIVVNDLTVPPTISIDNTSVCDPILSGNIFRLSLDQSKYKSCSFTFSSPDMTVSAGAVADYRVVSKNGTVVGSDITKLNSAISIDFTASGDTATLSIDLTNPNAGGHPLDNYGFNNENEYIISFDKNATIDDRPYVLTFVINLTFKTSQVIITQKRIQQAVFDSFNMSTLVSFDFGLNIDANERQFSFGFDKTYSIPTRVGTVIPNALKFPFDARYKPLQLFVLAQSIVRQSNFYSLKLIAEIQPPPNRSLVKQNTSVPFILEYRGSRNSFNLPIRLQ